MSRYSEELKQAILKWMLSPESQKRWSGRVRDWNLSDSVWLNPEKVPGEQAQAA